MGGDKQGENLPSALSCLLKTVKSGLLCRQPNMRVVLQHPSRQMARDRLDNVIRFARFEQPRYDRMPQSWNRSRGRPAASRNARQAVSHFPAGFVGSSL